LTIALIFTLALGAFAFTACTPSHLFITDSVSFDVQTERQFLGEVLNDLVEEERLEIEYSGSIDDAWGRFFLNIGDLNPSSDEWIGLFSTINNTTYSMMLNPISYNDKTFFSSLRGVDTMPIVKEQVTCFFFVQMICMPTILKQVQSLLIF